MSPLVRTQCRAVGGASPQDRLLLRDVWLCLCKPQLAIGLRRQQRDELDVELKRRLVGMADLLALTEDRSSQLATWECGAKE